MRLSFLHVRVHVCAHVHVREHVRGEHVCDAHVCAHVRARSIGLREA